MKSTLSRILYVCEDDTISGLFHETSEELSIFSCCNKKYSFASPACSHTSFVWEEASQIDLFYDENVVSCLTAPYP